ncbi:hypothetical protein ABGB18_32660 [Nonomuraea sp. B12E4]|uniref:AMIN-like domain-containing (lipo)protein n=1 Tax=Nonomuraea sp. B12E4 TaxID=3153564 RepID=UPI00325E3299
MRSRAAVPFACLVAVLTACGTSSDTVVPDRPPARAPSGGGEADDGISSGGSWPDDPEADLDAGAPPDRDPESGTSSSNSEVHVDYGGGRPALVTAVRYATHGTYDRVVVNLKGGTPGYHVTWVDRLVQEGSGKPIDVSGGAYLQLTIFPANARDRHGRSTWSGGPIYRADLGNLNQVVRTGEVKGRVGIGLVLDRQAGYQVRERPGRLTVDVAH